MFDSALCRFLRQVNEYHLMMDRGKDFLHQVLRCNCERRGVDARMAAEARVFQNGLADVPGDYVKKPMKECTGKEITEEWLYHLGVPVDQIPELAENSAVCVPTMMPYITAFFMPRRKGDRPDVIPDGCVNFAFLGQFAETPRDTIFTTEYSVRTAMEAVYGLLG